MIFRQLKLYHIATTLKKRVCETACNNPFTSIVAGLVFLVGVQLLIIFFNTMRGRDLLWPYNSYVHNPNIRFTDWLIAYEWAKIDAPWDISGALGQVLPPAPYGPLNVLYFRILDDWFGIESPTISFFIPLVIIIGLLCYSVARQIDLIENGKDIPTKILLILSLLVSAYPLHFIIDRGNTDVVGTAFFATVIYLLSSKNCAKNQNICAILVTAMALHKPSWLLFCLAVPFISGFFATTASMLTVIFGYTLGLKLLNGSLEQLINSGISAGQILAGVVHFSTHIGVINQFFAKFFAINSNLFVLPIFLCLVVLSLYVPLFFKHAFRNTMRNESIFILFTFLACLTVLINSPSPDYRLVSLLLLVPNYVLYLKRQNSIRVTFLFIICSIISFSWFNVWVHDFPIGSLLRTIGIIGLFSISAIHLLNHIYDKDRNGKPN